MPVTVYVDKDAKFGFIEEATWGTKVVTSMIELEVEPFQFKPTVNVLETNRAHAQRYKKPGDIIVDMKGSLHNLSVPATLAKKAEIDFPLYGVFQAVTEGESTPFTKVFEFGQTQPDFTASAGEFFTFGCDPGVASEHWTLADCIVNQLTLTCAPNAEGGYLTSQPEVIGRIFDGSDAITSFASAAAASFFNWHACAAKMNGTALVKGPDGFSLVITCTASKVGSAIVGTAEYFQTYALGEYAVELTAQYLNDATTKTAFANWQAGTTQSGITFEWGTADADGHLKFDLNGRYTDFDHSLTPEGQYATLHLKAAGTYGSTVPITVTLSNAVDRTW